MKLTRVTAQSCDVGSPEQFTGTVWNEVLAVGEPPLRIHAARVTFAPGARTAWHVHPLGQILLAVSGEGRVKAGDAPVCVLQPGDSVSIAPGERHWHGAAPDCVFVHVAIQAPESDGASVIWQEHVSDEVYREST